MRIDSVPLVAVAAVLAPLITELPGARVLPVVVVELALGILAGPVLHLTRTPTAPVQLAGLGMAFLFFMGGMEIDIRRISGRPLALGAGGWLLSLALAIVVAAALRLAGMDLPVEFIAAALCTTALGTLLPIMRDAGLLPTRLGRHAVAAGMCGELFPIIVISVVLTSTAERALEAAAAHRLRAGDRRLRYRGVARATRSSPRRCSCGRCTRPPSFRSAPASSCS